MKIGFNLLLWTDHVQRQHWPVLDELKHCGYDGVEAPVFEGRPDTYAELGDELDRRGLERTAISVSQAQRRIQLGRKPRSSFATVGKLPESGGPARVSCAKSPRVAWSSGITQEAVRRLQACGGNHHDRR